MCRVTKWPLDRRLANRYAPHVMKKATLAAVAALLLASPALAKPGINVQVSLEAAAPRAGTRDVKVTVLSPATQDLRVEVVSAGSVEVVKRAPARVHLEADQPNRFSIRVKQEADKEAHILVRVHGRRGAREAALDLAPEVTERKRQQAPKAPVDRTADGQPVMR